MSLRMPPVKNYSGQIFLAIIIICGYFGVFGYVLSHPIPQENRDVVTVMLGMLSTVLVGVAGYYFATSIGSQNKDDTISTAMEKMASPTVVPVISAKIDTTVQPLEGDKK